MQRGGLEETSLLEHEIMLTAKLLLVLPAIPIHHQKQSECSQVICCICGGNENDQSFKNKNEHTRNLLLPH